MEATAAVAELEKLQGWLAGIARNQIAGSFRAMRRAPTARAEALPMDAATDEAGPREQAINADQAELMWRALEAIPENYREPMVLFYREQRSANAVAAVLGITEETVRQRLVRGREMLTARMAAIVEETLERSAPKAAFAGAVMSGIPIGLVPAVISAGVSAAGAEVVGGGSVANYTGVGAVADVAIKGGLAVNIVAMVACLPPLLMGAQGFFRFRLRHSQMDDAAESRSAGWAYLQMHLSLGLALVGYILMIAPSKELGLRRLSLVEFDTPPAIYGVTGAALLAAALTGLRARLRLDRYFPEPFLSSERISPVGEFPGFQFWTAKEFLGLPLVHLCMGRERGWTRPAVKGWIAISDGRSVGGLFAVGVVAVAPLSVGLISVGLLSLGCLSAGFWAAGLGAAGWSSHGVAAAGW